MSSSLELKSSTGKPKKQLDGSADAADASSTAGSPDTVIGRDINDGQEREGYRVSHAGHLRFFASQHLRSAAREQQIPEHEAIKRLNKIVDGLSTRDQLVYENLIGQDGPDEIEIPAGDDHDDSARGHRSHASSSMLDPDRGPETSRT